MEGDKRLLQDKQFIWGLSIGFIGVAVFGVAVWGLFLLNSKSSVITESSYSNDTIEKPLVGPETESITNPSINTFELKKDATICKEEEKPVVYLFSTTACPHCEWVKPIFDKVASEYIKSGKIRAYHWELDTGDNTLTAETESHVPEEVQNIYREFNPDDSVPTFVFGCKYFRVGNGYEPEGDTAKEEQELRAVIDDLLK